MCLALFRDRLLAKKPNSFFLETYLFLPSEWSVMALFVFEKREDNKTDLGLAIWKILETHLPI